MTNKWVKRYYDRKQSGLCVRCGRASQANKTHCFKCSLWKSEYNRAYRERTTA